MNSSDIAEIEVLSEIIHLQVYVAPIPGLNLNRDADTGVWITMQTKRVISHYTSISIPFLRNMPWM